KDEPAAVPVLEQYGSRAGASIGADRGQGHRVWFWQASLAGVLEPQAEQIEGVVRHLRVVQRTRVILNAHPGEIRFEVTWTGRIGCVGHAGSDHWASTRRQQDSRDVDGFEILGEACDPGK